MVKKLLNLIYIYFKKSCFEHDWKIITNISLFKDINIEILNDRYLVCSICKKIKIDEKYNAHIEIKCKEKSIIC